MRSILFRFALAASLVYAAATADAKPRRVVVLEFDGQRSFADAGRNTVMSLLGDQYDVVATRRWETARAQASGHGPQQWQQAAQQAGVDAVIEGYVQDEGRHHVLTIVVREAATGREMDSLSIRIANKGLDADQSRKLGKQLDEIFEWIEGDPTASEAGSHLPDVRTLRPMLGARQPEARDGERDDDTTGDGDDDDRPEPRHRHHRRHHREIASVDDDDRAPPAKEAGREPAKTAEPATAAEEAKPAAKGDAKPDAKTVAIADDAKDTNDLVRLFGPESKEADVVSDHKAAHVPRPTPRFMIGAGGYYASRGMTFESDPNATVSPPEYPASGIQGFALDVAVYPLPTQKVDGDLSGVGFTLALQHSVGSVLTAMDDTGYGDSTLEHTAWEFGLHYRWPIDIVAIDAAVSYGNDTHSIIDLPESIELPDTSVTYLGAGAHLDLRVTDRATVGFGGKYLYVLSGGDINSEDWYGAGGASGLDLEADFVVPLPGPLFVRGAIDYRRISFDFEGSGTLAQEFGMWSAVDTSIGVVGQVGVKF